MSGRGSVEGRTPGSPRREAVAAVFAADLPPSSPLASKSVLSYVPHETKTTGERERERERERQNLIKHYRI